MTDIEYTKKEKIAYVLLNRSEYNPISFEMVGILDGIWQDFQRDGNVRVAILGSRKKNFSAGFDINDIRDMLGQEGYSWEKSSMFGKIRMGPDGHDVTKPIICALDGIVNGAALWLVLQSDIRIATSRTIFGLAEGRLNFPVEFSGLLARYMPSAIVHEMLFTGRNFDAQRFYELGIINKIVEPTLLMIEAVATAESICSSGEKAIQVMKHLIKKGYEMEYGSLMKFSGKMIVPVVNSKETKTAVEDFLAKNRSGTRSE